MRTFIRTTAAWIITAILAHAGYIGGYTARIGPADHYTSQGVPLERAVDILQQDRANYYRFGVRDPDDTGCGYFASRRNRARMERMLRYDPLSPRLAGAIRQGTPLVRVEVYDGRMEVRLLPPPSAKSPTASPPSASRPAARPAATTLSTLRRVLTDDALRQLRTHARTDRMGFETAALRHRSAGVYFAREGNRTVAWVVLASSPRTDFECHACKPALSVFVYAQERAQAWRPVGRAWQVFSGGSGYGVPPEEKEMALVHIAPDRVALAIRTADMHMGWETEAYTLIGVEKDRAQTLLATLLKENNAGTLEEKKTDWTSTIRIRPGRSRCYDILLHRKGILRGVPIDYTVTYRCDGHTYRPEQEDPVTVY